MRKERLIGAARTITERLRMGGIKVLKYSARNKYIYVDAFVLDSAYQKLIYKRAYAEACHNHPDIPSKFILDKAAFGDLLNDKWRKEFDIK